MLNAGRLFVISAPSGAGKSTLTAMIIKKFAPKVRFSVSYTSRAPRKGEQNGVDYFFVSQDEFKSMIDKGEFIEWAQVHGNFYGTSKAFIDKSLEEGTDVILDIDPQGALQIKKKIDHAVFIFIIVSSMSILKERLLKRGTDSEETIARRMKNAYEEVEYFKEYDYIVFNDEANSALEDMLAIYRAEKLRAFKFEKVSDFTVL